MSLKEAGGFIRTVGADIKKKRLLIGKFESFICTSAGVIRNNRGLYLMKQPTETDEQLFGTALKRQNGKVLF